MRIYTNKQGTEFLQAVNDPDFQEQKLADLKQTIHFFPENDLKQEQKQEDALTKVILTLPLNKQIKLANALHEESGMDTPLYHLASARKEYRKIIKQDDPAAEYDNTDFLTEFHTGNKGILYGLDQMFETLSWNEMELVLNTLDEELDPMHWQSWQITGYSQGDLLYAWTYDPQIDLSIYNQTAVDNQQDDFYGMTFTDKLRNLVFDNFVYLVSCDKNGNPLVNPEIARELGGYDAENDPASLDEYIWKNYHLKPAAIKQSYYTNPD